MRKGKNRGLPPYLYAHGTNRWRYAHPSLPRPKHFSADRATAIREAKAANAKLANSTGLILDGEGLLMSSVIGRYKREHLPTLPLADSTRRDRLWRLKTIQSDLGSTPVDQLDVRAIAEWLDDMPARSANMFRSVLVQLFNWAIAKGLAEHNPATATLVRPERKQRPPLTWEQYAAILEEANTPTRNAMQLCMATLQRRTDISRMQFSHVQDGYLRVHQSKTGKRLLLPVTDDLRAAIAACRDDVLSPYMVHQPAGNKRRTGKPLSPESITRGFARAARAAHISGPSFHEILGLAEARKKEDGWSDERIQAWRGHTTVQMTQHYMAGHEVWEKVK